MNLLSCFSVFITKVKILQKEYKMPTDKENLSDLENLYINLKKDFIDEFKKQHLEGYVQRQNKLKNEQLAPLMTKKENIIQKNKAKIEKQKSKMEKSGVKKTDEEILIKVLGPLDKRNFKKLNKKVEALSTEIKEIDTTMKQAVQEYDKTFEKLVDVKRLRKQIDELKQSEAKPDKKHEKASTRKSMIQPKGSARTQKSSRVQESQSANDVKEKKSRKRRNA